MQKWMNFTHNRVVIQTFRRGGCVFSRKRRLHEAFTHDVLRGVYNFPNSPENVFLTWAKRNTWLWVSYIRFNALCPCCLDCRGFQGIYRAALTPQNHLGEFHANCLFWGAQYVGQIHKMTNILDPERCVVQSLHLPGPHFYW